MKSTVDKLDVDQLVPVPVDLKKLCDVVDKNVIKKDIYDELDKNANAIKTTDNSDLVKKLTTKQKLIKLNRKLLIMIIVISILLLKNLIG